MIEFGRRRCSPVLVAVLAAGCSSPTPPAPAAVPAPAQPSPAMAVVDGALRAVGGRAAVAAADRLVMEGEGELFALGQNRTPESELPVYRITEVRRDVDLAGGRSRQEQFLTSRHWGPLKLIAALDGDIAFDVGEDGSATRASDSDARDRRLELRHHPIAMLRLAIAPGAAVSGRRQVQGREVVDIRVPDGELFTLAVDPATGLPVTVTSNIDYYNLGDAVMVTEFADYRAAGDLMLPALITSRVDRQIASVLRVSKNAVVAPKGSGADLAAPAAVRSTPAPAPAPQVTVDDLASGVWRLKGTTHHSVLVEFADHLTLIEAPRDEAYTLAIIARARQVRPDKRLTHVVVTHHHFDHSGGVRAAVSQGLTVIAHEKIQPFLEAMMARPRTIAPDALARNPRQFRMEAVGARTVLRDSIRTMELHAVDSEHAEGMLIAYLPREQLLVEVDLYTPRTPESPPLRSYTATAALLDAMKAQKMKVERVVPLHRDVVPFAQMVAAAAKDANPDKPEKPAPSPGR
jgi:glyoxylase-like metal-dependent hydrolase (beta-lactamase superfamily II)